jgi:hypothetical protein
VQVEMGPADRPPRKACQNVGPRNGLNPQGSAVEWATTLSEWDTQPEPERTAWAAGISSRYQQLSPSAPQQILGCTSSSRGDLTTVGCDWRVHSGNTVSGQTVLREGRRIADHS